MQDMFVRNSSVHAKNSKNILKYTIYSRVIKSNYVYEYI